MSYARLTEGDVYAQRWADCFGTGQDGYVCQGCSRPNSLPLADIRSGGDRSTLIYRTAAGFMAHLEMHRLEGDNVDVAIKSLAEEIP